MRRILEVIGGENIHAAVPFPEQPG